MFVEVVQVKGRTVARSGRLQSLGADKQRGCFLQIHGIGESRDEHGEADVDAVTGKVSVVGQGVHHGARASDWITP